MAQDQCISRLGGWEGYDVESCTTEVHRGVSWCEASVAARFIVEDGVETPLGHFGTIHALSGLKLRRDTRQKPALESSYGNTKRFAPLSRLVYSPFGSKA